MFFFSVLQGSVIQSSVLGILCSDISHTSIILVQRLYSGNWSECLFGSFLLGEDAMSREQTFFY